MHQLLTEGLLVSLAGAGVGILLAYWMGHWFAGFKKLFTVQLVLHPAALDVRVVLFILVLAILMGLAFSIAPALQSSRLFLNTALKESSFQTSSGGYRRLRHTLVIAEIAVAFVGMAGAATLMHTLRVLNSANLGLDPGHVLSVSTELYTQHYSTADGLRFYSQLTEGVRSLPAVRSAALVSDLPLTTIHSSTHVEKPGQETSQADAWQSVEENTISPGYFKTLRIPLLRGREITAGDTQGAPEVVIINRTMARIFWPRENPIGKRILIKGKNAQAEVVGVAADVKQHDAWEAAEPLLYEPFSQSTGLWSHLLVRTRGDPTALLPAVRQQVDALDPRVPVYAAETMEQVAADSMAEPRMAASLVSCFGTLLLLLAVAGIYGVITHWVAQRTHEIGIRMALGAQKKDVLRHVLSQGLRLTVGGLAAGLIGAFILTRLLSSLLYGVKPTDAMTFAAVAVILIAVAVLACYIPARRATRVDPMVALRHE